ncbi:MAG: hypothetical protein KBD29_00570 [Candidatus Magasanikbacteria bacterium]|nr:hypothetical protein [Candidatus Magasanikbacteria bacterium]
MKIINTIKKFWVRGVLVSLSIAALPSRVWGQGNLGNADDNLENLQKGIGGNVPTDLTVVVGNVIKTVLSLVGIIFLVLTVYAGYLWMTARGEDEQVSKAKEIIKSSIMGLFIVVSSYAITVFITSRFSGQ